MYVIHLIILSVLGINPVRYVKKTLEVLIFAFTSRSSAGALPLNIQTQTQRLGVPEGIANFCNIWIINWTKRLRWNLPSYASNHGRACRTCPYRFPIHHYTDCCSDY